MSTTCSHCGEALMGAVNRCWRCGTTFAEPTIADAPPIRRLAILPEYLEPQYGEARQRRYAASQIGEVDIYEAELGESSSPPTDSSLATPPARWRPSLAQWIETALLLVAMGALLFTFFTPWGIPLTFLALILTAARIHHQQSRLGWAAFIFALFSLVLCIARAVLLLYQWTYPNVAPPWLPVW